MTAKAFRKKCEVAFSAIDSDPLYFEDEEMEDDAFEDDGCLHVRVNCLRACFDVSNGQSLSGREQNIRTRAVMESLGLVKKFEPLTGRVLVDESEPDDDSCCPTCGREY